MYRGAYIWEGGGAYNLLDVFFVYKQMVPPEYNWPEGWGGGGGKGFLMEGSLNSLQEAVYNLWKSHKT